MRWKIFAFSSLFSINKFLCPQQFVTKFSVKSVNVVEPLFNKINPKKIPCSNEIHDVSFFPESPGSRLSEKVVRLVRLGDLHTAASRTKTSQLAWLA